MLPTFSYHVPQNLDPLDANASLLRNSVTTHSKGRLPLWKFL